MARSPYYHKLLGGPIGLLMILILAACGPGTAPSALAPQRGAGAAPAQSGAAPTGQGQPAAASAAAPANPQSAWEAVAAAARQEGVLVLAGPPSQPSREALLKFEQAYPGIRVDYSGMAPPEFEPRVAAERRAEQYLWDVWVSGVSSTVFTRQIPQGWYDPILPAVMLPDVLDDNKWAGGFEAGFLDKGKQYAYAFAMNTSDDVMVNTSLVPEGTIRSFQDLFDPRWKGKIAMDDPRGRGAGSNAVTLLRRTVGDEAVRRLVIDQEPVFTTNSRQLAEWIARGQYPVAVGVNSTDLTRLQRDGLGTNVKPVALVEGERVTPGWGAVLLLNRAPHPNAAKVFINWLLTQEAQTYWAELGAVNSRRTDVAPGDPHRLPDWAKLDRYYNFNNEENGTIREETIELVKKLVGS